MAKRRKLQSKLPPQSQKKKLHQYQPQKQHDNAKDRPKKSASKQQQKIETPTIPFDPHHRILLIGEADLSFAASIIRHHGCANVTATVLEKDYAELAEKYPTVDANVAVIEGNTLSLDEKTTDHTTLDKDAGGDAEDEENVDSEDEDDADDTDNDDDDGDDDKTKTTNRTITITTNKIIYGVDATKPPPSITRKSHDRILFNFPHVGGKSTDVNRQVRYNQELLVSFFQRTLPALAPGGRVVVTLFEGEPYTLWNVRDLARHAGLQVDRSFRFQASAYPGYAHARTIGVVKNKKGETGGGWRGEDRASRSYVFMRKGDARDPTPKKRRRDDDDSSDEDSD